jgi:transglutaminase-like putative cysteine protease
MILEVQHETRFEFSDPVTEVLTEVRMEPSSNTDQSCHSYHLGIVPTTGVFRFQDGFGNRVHHFNLLAPQRELRILSASIVETHVRPRELASSQSTYLLDPERHALEVLDFVNLRGPARPTPRLNPLLDVLRPQPGTRLVDLVQRVAAHIHAHFEYARDVTLASSPIDDVLQQGKGVCQDFTHLMLAVLRSFGVPARYVSGYLHRADEDSQSHAWCEAWVPDLGWLGIDPTNDCLVNDHFVRVAVGRDFTDVPPNRGVYRGRARESIFVRVATRELERVPSLSWQEQLPPLTAPLTEIVLRPRAEAGPDEDSLQQQQ